jgi:hypothetical protein
MQIYAKALDTMKPGVDDDRVFEESEKVAREAGYTLEPPIGGTIIGHGIGLDLGEGSTLREGRFKLAPNMVFAIEPGIYLPGCRVYHPICSLSRRGRQIFERKRGLERDKIIDDLSYQPIWLPERECLFPRQWVGRQWEGWKSYKKCERRGLCPSRQFCSKKKKVLES